MPNFADSLTSIVKSAVIIIGAYAAKIWILYFACGLGFLDSTTTTVMRSMIIATVPNTELGKVFSILEYAKGLLLLIGPVIYGKLYENTLRTVPEAFIYLSMVCKCFVFIAVVVILIELNKKCMRERSSQKER